MSDANEELVTNVNPEDLGENPDSINRIHSVCKKCSFAIYEDKTQTDCALGYIEKYRSNGASIVEAYDDDREFYIINNKKCLGYREDKFFPENSTMEEKIELFNQKNHINYLMVINLKDLNSEDLLQMADKISQLDIKPQKIVFVRYQEEDKRHEYSKIEQVLKTSTYDGPWQIKTMLVEADYYSVLHEIMNFHKSLRFVLSIKGLGQFDNLVSAGNKTVYVDLKSFIAYTNQDGSCLLFSSPNYRYSLHTEKVDLLTETSMHTVID